MAAIICIALLQGLSYRQLDLGMSFRQKMEGKKGVGAILKGCKQVLLFLYIICRQNTHAHPHTQNIFK
jgi:hypothetical protein